MKTQSLVASALLCAGMSSVTFAGSLAVNNGQPTMSSTYPSTLSARSFDDFSQNTNNFYDSVKNSTAAGRFNDVVRFLADQLTQNRDIKNLAETHFAVASIVALDDVSHTNKIGFLLQEHLLHELQTRGFKVVDFKLMSDQIQVTKDGDFAFSRDVKRLKKSYDVAQVVSGSYSFQAEGIVFNLRAIDTKTGVISTTAQGYLGRSDYEYITTGREGTYYSGEYFYREPQRVRVIEVPVAYPAEHNKVLITK
jgi:TolB-like protein